MGYDGWMVEITRIPFGTKVVKNSDGKYEPVADDDPRAQWATAFDHIVVDGVHMTRNPTGGWSQTMSYVLLEGPNLIDFWDL